MSSPEGLDYLGRADIALAASQLSARLPKALSGLGPVAFNYRWSWTRSGGDVFSLIDPIRWDRCEHNPVRLLLEASEASLDRAANDVALVAAAEELCRDVADGTCPRRAALRLVGASDRFSVCRVRRPRLAPHLLWRPRRPRGRHPEGSLRPRPPHDWGRSPLPDGLLPPTPRHFGVSARVLGGLRSRPAAHGVGTRRKRRASARVGAGRG